MMRDIRSNVDVAQTFAPAARTATASGSSVDLQGYDAAMFEFSAGAWTDGSHTPSAEHSDDNTTWTACAASDLQGAFAAVTAAPGGNTVQRVGYVGGKRYVRGKSTVTGATTGMLFGMNVVRSGARVKPLA
jgi:hypothetical protein